MQDSRLLNRRGQSPRPLTRPCMGSFLSRRKFAWYLAAGGAWGPLEARSCPSKPWRRKMSLARRLSRPKPPEAVAEGQPLQGYGQRRRSAAEVGGPRLRPSVARSFAPPTRVRTKAAARRRAERLRRGAHGHARPLSLGGIFD